MKAIWNVSMAIVKTLLVICGMVNIIIFNHTHELYYGIDALICIAIASMNLEFGND